MDQRRRKAHRAKDACCARSDELEELKARDSFLVSGSEDSTDEPAPLSEAKVQR
jgi:hypothetical protein